MAGGIIVVPSRRSLPNNRTVQQGVTSGGNGTENNRPLLSLEVIAEHTSTPVIPRGLAVLRLFRFR